MKYTLFVFTVLLIMVGINVAAEEHRKVVVVIDTRISESQFNADYMCENGSEAMNPMYESFYTNTDQISSTDPHFHHGQNVVGLIAENLDSKKYCIHHIMVAFTETPKYKTIFYIGALKRALEIPNVVGVNLSISANPNPQNYSANEKEILEKMTARGIKVITSIGNYGTKLTKANCYVYPACLQFIVSKPSNFYVVGSTERDVLRKPSSIIFGSDYEVDAIIIRRFDYSTDLRVDKEDALNRGTPVMNGTSQATASFTGKLFSK